MKPSPNPIVPISLGAGPKIHPAASSVIMVTSSPSANLPTDQFNSAAPPDNPPPCPKASDKLRDATTPAGESEVRVIGHSSPALSQPAPGPTPEHPTCHRCTR